MATMMISDRQAAMLQDRFARQEGTIDKLKKQKARERVTGMAFQVGEAFLGALGTGFIRGKLEASGKTFALGPVDGELVIAALLIGAGATKYFGKYGEHLMNAGVGVLGHYAGQMGRALGSGKQLNGTVIGMLPEHVGNNPTYVGRGMLGQGSVSAADLASALAASAA